MLLFCYFYKKMLKLSKHDFANYYIKAESSYRETFHKNLYIFFQNFIIQFLLSEIFHILDSITLETTYIIQTYYHAKFSARNSSYCVLLCDMYYNSRPSNMRESRVMAFNLFLAIVQKQMHR